MMRSKSSLLITIIFLLPAICLAQNLNSKVLMTVGGSEIQAGEFIRMLKKSIEPGKKPDVDSYLQDYILFKLKVADACSEGIDTTKAFLNELSGYRNQLAQSYLTDTNTRERLIKQAYQRSLTEINAWHILVELSPEASAADTMIAWQKANDIRERILKGESFEKVARGTSDDQSVKINGGNLGYFTVFQMIMPFEDAAYSLRPGAISMPVRTPYGYHIIKITSKRPSRGKIKVAHIMKSAPPGIDEKVALKAEEEINGIYTQLRNGGSFSELAKQFSDHKESALKGGELDWFGAGEIISDFSEAAFSISDTGKYTPPVRTNYGWHIIKLLDKKEPGSLEETRSYLESKINQSYLNSYSRKLFVEKLKKEYKFRINQDAYNWFVQNTDTLIIRGLKKYSRTDFPRGNIYSFANQHISTTDFVNYVEKRGSRILTNDPGAFINSSLDSKVTDHVIEYENSVLETKYPDFRYLINEFHDGILLFEISAEKVWNRAGDDSTGLRKYYEENKMKYLSPRGIRAKIYSLSMPDGKKKLQSAYKKYSRKPDIDKRLTAKFNSLNDTVLKINSGVWSLGDDRELDNIQWVKGTHSFTKNGVPSIIDIMAVIEPAPKAFDDIQEEMMTGFQDYLEKEWIKQLKAKYTVKIDNLVLEELKNFIINE